VSEAWVEQQTRTQVQLGNTGLLPIGGYGYQTWTDGAGTGSIVLLGYGGQIVWIVPARNLVVVAIANWRGVNDYDGHQSLGQVSIVNEVIAAAR
jgi:CubicO group peptidase (beta-lactamase class C family)